MVRRLCSRRLHHRGAGRQIPSRAVDRWCRCYRPAACFAPTTPGTTLRDNLELDGPKISSHNNKENPLCRNHRLFWRADATPAVWAENVNINGTGVSIEANKTPINTAKNGDAIRAVAERLSLCRAGKFTVAVAPQSTAADGFLG